MNNKMKNTVMLIIFIVALALIIIGQRNIGYAGLAMELIGLCGLITLLFVYNKGHK